jgi:ABC-type glycerol-3-phosphate transport system permease component
MTELAGTATTSRSPRQPSEVRRRRPGRIRDVVIVAVTVVACVTIAFPFAWMVVTSFFPTTELFSVTRLLPRIGTATLTNYVQLLTESNFLTYIGNSLIVSVCAMTVSVVLSSMSGYAFSRYRFRGRRAIMVAIIAVHLFPFVILITPMYSFFSELGLLNTHLGLIIAYVAITLPFASYLMLGFFQTIPISLDEAARVDGCGTVSVLFRIVLPVAWPGIATVAVNAFILSWEEYLFAKVLVTDDNLKTVQVGLANFFGEFTTRWDLVMAASVLASVPTILLFAVAQRRLVSGLAAGGVKE